MLLVLTVIGINFMLSVCKLFMSCFVIFFCLLLMRDGFSLLYLIIFTLLFYFIVYFAVFNYIFCVLFNLIYMKFKYSYKYSYLLIWYSDAMLSSFKYLIKVQIWDFNYLNTLRRPCLIRLNFPTYQQYA